MPQMKYMFANVASSASDSAAKRQRLSWPELLSAVDPYSGSGGDPYSAAAAGYLLWFLLLVNTHHKKKYNLRCLNQYHKKRILAVICYTIITRKWKKTQLLSVMLRILGKIKWRGKLLHNGQKNWINSWKLNYYFFVVIISLFLKSI